MYSASRTWWPISLTVGLAFAMAGTPALWGGCGFFAAKGQDVWQPGQTVFLTWDPQTKIETLTMQPAFEGQAQDFALIVPTPSRPKLQPMPRAFFRHLAVFTHLKHREFPRSKLLPLADLTSKRGRPTKKPASDSQEPPQVPAVTVFEAGIVGTLDYKIIGAGRPDALYKWLKDNDYPYAGAEAALNAYVKKGWVFTVFKIDSAQMRKNRDGIYLGEVAPMRLQFSSAKLVYPLRIAQASAHDRADVLFYVQAPFKVDLPGDLSYQHTWIPMLQGARSRVGGLPGKAADWLEAAKAQFPALLKRGRELGFDLDKQPLPKGQARTPTALEWARRLTERDLQILRGEAPYSEPFPDADNGFAKADLKDPRKAEAIFRVIRQRLAKARKDQPQGYLVRRATAEDVHDLRELAEHLRAGQFLTRFRKSFTRAEMTDDLELTAARLGPATDSSEYTEMLPRN